MQELKVEIRGNKKKGYTPVAHEPAPRTHKKTDGIRKRTIHNMVEGKRTTFPTKTELKKYIKNLYINRTVVFVDPE